MDKETIIKTRTATESRSRREIKPLERKEVKIFEDNECPPPFTEQAANNEDLFLRALLGEI